MKKILLSLLLALLIFIPSNVLAASDKITIYLFRGNTCPHCEEAIEYINAHRDKIEGYEFLTYETWKNKNNDSLLRAVGEKLGINEDDIGSVPLFVVGDKYIVGYRNSTTIDTVIGNAESFKNGEEEYKDIVNETMAELKQETAGINFQSMTLNDIFPEPNPIVNIIIYSVFGILVIGFIAMIAFSRNK